MRSLGRIAVMIVVSLLTLTICGGGYRDLNAFAFVGLLLVMFGGLPLIGLITLFHFLDRRFGPYARYPIALIGLFPFLLVINFGGRGDAIYIRNIVFSGLAWSASWLATSYIFSRMPRDVQAFVPAVVLVLPWAFVVIAISTGHLSLGRWLVGPTNFVPRDESKFFGKITGAKVLRCHDHECIVLTCREQSCVEAGRLVPQN